MDLHDNGLAELVAVVAVVADILRALVRGNLPSAGVLHGEFGEKLAFEPRQQRPTQDARGGKFLEGRGRGQVRTGKNKRDQGPCPLTIVDVL